MPKSPERVMYWREKLDGNAQRDIEHYIALRSMGWQVLVIWECETKEPDIIEEKVRTFLD